MRWHARCSSRRGDSRAVSPGTRAPGLYVAGDASEGVQLVIVAPSEGAKVRFAINMMRRQEEMS